MRRDENVDSLSHNMRFVTSTVWFLAVFDKDGNGFITPSELRLAMSDLGENLTDKQLQDMVIAADLDGDGRINYRGLFPSVYVVVLYRINTTCLYVGLHVYFSHVYDNVQVIHVSEFVRMMQLEMNKWWPKFEQSIRPNHGL